MHSTKCESALRARHGSGLHKSSRQRVPATAVLIPHANNCMNYYDYFNADLGGELQADLKEQ